MDGMPSRPPVRPQPIASVALLLCTHKAADGRIEECPVTAYLSDDSSDGLLSASQHMELLKTLHVRDMEENTDTCEIVRAYLAKSVGQVLRVSALLASLEIILDVLDECGDLPSIEGDGLKRSLHIAVVGSEERRDMIWSKIDTRASVDMYQVGDTVRPSRMVEICGRHVR